MINKFFYLAKKPVIVSIILFSLFFIYSYHLSYRKMWYDEIDRIATAEREMPLWNNKQFCYRPLYIAVLKFFIDMTGKDDFHVRFISVLLAVLGVMGEYYLIKKIFDVKTAFLAAFFMAVSPCYVYYAREAMHFLLLIIVSMVAYYEFFLYIDLIAADTKENTLTKKGIVLGITSFFAVSIHPAGIFIVISLVICLFFVLFFSREKSKQVKNILISLLLFCVVYAFFLKVFFAGTIKDLIKWMDIPSYTRFFSIFTIFATGGNDYGRNAGSMYCDFYKLFPVMKYLCYLGGVISLILFGYFVGKCMNKKRYFFVLLFFIVPVFSIYLISYLCSGVYAGKHLLLTMPVFFGIISFSILKLKKIGAVLGGLLLVIVLIRLPFVYTDYEIDWRKAAEIIRNKTKTGDVVILWTQKEMVSFFYYYNNNVKRCSFWGYIGEDNKTYTASFYCDGIYFITLNSMNIDIELEKNKTYLQQANRIFFVGSFWDGDPTEFIMTYLKNINFYSIWQKDFNGIQIIYFEKQEKHYEEKKI